MRIGFSQQRNIFIHCSIGSKRTDMKTAFLGIFACFLVVFSQKTKRSLQIQILTHRMKCRWGETGAVSKSLHQSLPRHYFTFPEEFWARIFDLHTQPTSTLKIHLSCCLKVHIHWIYISLCAHRFSTNSDIRIALKKLINGSLKIFKTRVSSHKTIKWEKSEWTFIQALFLRGKAGVMFFSIFWFMEFDWIWGFGVLRRRKPCPSGQFFFFISPIL